jgi:hypothetical protein
VAQRPEKFTKVVTAAEKKLLQDVLERGLGVSRRKAAPRPAAKKAPVPRKRAPKKKEKEYF